MVAGLFSGESTTELLVTLCWVAFIVFWIISAFGTKQYVRRGSWGIGIRIVIILIFIAVFQFQGTREFFLQEQFALSPIVQWIGVVLSICGVACAIWARTNLGRNWGMPMSLKKDPDLVTSGPYQYVRHPIYSGMLLTMLGTTLVIIWWAVPLVIFFIYFAYAARTEEKIMIGQFGEKYADYMKRTKMLVPFVF